MDSRLLGNARLIGMGVVLVVVSAFHLRASSHTGPDTLGPGPLPTASAKSVPSSSSLPMSDVVANETAAVMPSLCRFGFGQARRSVNDYGADQLARLRAGLYMNWGTALAPASPNDMEFVQTVFVKQWKWKEDHLVLADYAAPYAVPYTYTVSPRGSSLAGIAAANPGSLWLIGNEMERRDWRYSSGGTGFQNEILPEVYALAYHEAYTTIKTADPTARVAIGGMIQATPLRLQYLDRVWDEYGRLYGVPMPVDWWNVHAFILQEKRDDWGADIPAGLSAAEGILYTVDQNKEWSNAIPLIYAFRQWMKDHGQQQKPLIVSEYSVNMPWFTAKEVRDDFMYPSFDFFLNTKNPDLGYAADDNRMVQKWIWYSLDDDQGGYNGALFYSGLYENPMGITPLGAYWESYVNSVTEDTNLIPTGLTYRSVLSSGEPVTVTLSFDVSNSGHTDVQSAFDIQVLGDGVPIATRAINALQGCGQKTMLSVIWTNVTPGVHTVVVKVDASAAIVEVNEGDNQLTRMVLVPTQRVLLPISLKVK